MKLKVKKLAAYLTLIIPVLMFLSCGKGDEATNIKGIPLAASEEHQLPPCPVLATGQTNTRYYGDDGEWLAGRKLSSQERFKDNADGTFTDRLTGLMWMYELPDPAETGYGKMFKAVKAKAGFLHLSAPPVRHSTLPKVEQKDDVYSFLEALNTGALSTFNRGRGDWRWPTLPELTSLFVFAARNTGEDAPQDFPATFLRAKTIDYDFGLFSACTPVSALINKRWDAAFLGVSKMIRPQEGKTCCLLPVRSMSPEERQLLEQSPVRIPAVGPRGKDPEADKQWPNPRFVVKDGGTPQDVRDDIVVDRLTGLSWSRQANPSGREMGWYDALNYCNKFKLGRYDDWRMPNTFEMLSLVCYGLHSPALTNTQGDGEWKEADPFIEVQSRVYWTSTEGLSAAGERSYVVDLGKGGITEEYVGSPLEGVIGRFASRYPKHPVWPVRGGFSTPEDKKKSK